MRRHEARADDRMRGELLAHPAYGNAALGQGGRGGANLIAHLPSIGSIAGLVSGLLAEHDSSGV